MCVGDWSSDVVLFRSYPERPPRNLHGDWPFLRPPERVPEVPVITREHLPQLFVTPWNVACQAPLSMGFSRQEYWSGWQFPSLEDRPNPGIELTSPSFQADSLPTESPGNVNLCLLLLRFAPKKMSFSLPICQIILKLEMKIGQKLELFRMKTL